MQSDPPVRPPPIPVLAQSHSFTRLNLPLAGNRFVFLFIIAGVFRCLTRSLPVTHMAVSKPPSVSLLSSPLPLAAVLADQLNKSARWLCAASTSHLCSCVTPCSFTPPTPPPLLFFFFLSLTQLLLPLFPLPLWLPAPLLSAAESGGSSRPLHV